MRERKRLCVCVSTCVHMKERQTEQEKVISEVKNNNFMFTENTRIIKKTWQNIPSCNEYFHLISIHLQN